MRFKKLVLFSCICLVQNSLAIELNRSTLERLDTLSESLRKLPPETLFFDLKDVSEEIKKQETYKKSLELVPALKTSVAELRTQLSKIKKMKTVAEFRKVKETRRLLDDLKKQLQESNKVRGRARNYYNRLISSIEINLTEWEQLETLYELTSKELNKLSGTVKELNDNLEAAKKKKGDSKYLFKIFAAGNVYLTMQSKTKRVREKSEPPSDHKFGQPKEANNHSPKVVWRRR